MEDRVEDPSQSKEGTVLGVLQRGYCRIKKIPYFPSGIPFLLPEAVSCFSDSLVQDTSEGECSLGLGKDLANQVLFKLDAKALRSVVLVSRFWHARGIRSLFNPNRENTTDTQRYRTAVLRFHLQQGCFPYASLDDSLRVIASDSFFNYATLSAFSLGALENPRASDIFALQTLSVSGYVCIEDIILSLCSTSMLDPEMHANLSRIGWRLALNYQGKEDKSVSTHCFKVLSNRLDPHYYNKFVQYVGHTFIYKFDDDQFNQFFSKKILLLEKYSRLESEDAMTRHEMLIGKFLYAQNRLNIDQRGALISHLTELFRKVDRPIGNCSSQLLAIFVPYLSLDQCLFFAECVTKRLLHKGYLSRKECNFGGFIFSKLATRLVGSPLEESFQNFLFTYISIVVRNSHQFGIAPGCDDLITSLNDQQVSMVYDDLLQKLEKIISLDNSFLNFLRILGRCGSRLNHDQLRRLISMILQKALIAPLEDSGHTFFNFMQLKCILGRIVDDSAYDKIGNLDKEFTSLVARSLVDPDFRWGFRLKFISKIVSVENADLIFEEISQQFPVNPYGCIDVLFELVRHTKPSKTEKIAEFLNATLLAQQDARLENLDERTLLVVVEILNTLGINEDQASIACILLEIIRKTVSQDIFQWAYQCLIKYGLTSNDQDFVYRVYMSRVSAFQFMYDHYFINQYFAGGFSEEETLEQCKNRSYSGGSFSPSVLCLAHRLSQSNKDEFMEFLILNIESEEYWSVYNVLGFVTEFIPYCQDVDIPLLEDILERVSSKNKELRSTVAGIQGWLCLNSGATPERMSRISSTLCAYSQQEGSDSLRGLLGNCFFSRVQSELNRGQALGKLELQLMFNNITKPSEGALCSAMERATVLIRNLGYDTPLSVNDQFRLVHCFLDLPLPQKSIPETLYLKILRRLRESKKLESNGLIYPKIPNDALNIAHCLAILVKAECLSRVTFNTLLTYPDSNHILKQLRTPGIDSNDIRTIMKELKLLIEDLKPAPVP